MNTAIAGHCGVRNGLVHTGAVALLLGAALTMNVARAAENDKPGTEPEIAYGTGDKSIIVERYQGKLPRNLATSI